MQLFWSGVKLNVAECVARLRRARKLEYEEQLLPGIICLED